MVYNINNSFGLFRDISCSKTSLIYISTKSIMYLDHVGKLQYKNNSVMVYDLLDDYSSKPRTPSLTICMFRENLFFTCIQIR